MSNTGEQPPSPNPAAVDGSTTKRSNRVPNRGRGGRKHNKKYKKAAKPKMTKEERRAKYTKIAHDRRDKKFAATRGRHLVCYRCRKKGHASADYPLNQQPGSEDGCGKAGTNSQGRGVVGRLCFKCGSIEHGLSHCPKMKNASRLPSGKFDYANIDMPFASCFVCGGMGHLASNCNQNEGRGIFVKGGGCRLCGSKHHIAADCPDNEKRKKKSNDRDGCIVIEPEGAVVDDLLEDIGDDVGDFPEQDAVAATTEPKAPKRRKKKVVNF